MREDVEMSFGEHLEELRRRIIYALLGLLVASVFCGIKYQFLLQALARPYKNAYERLIASQLNLKQPDEGPKRPPLEIPDDAPLASVLKAFDERLAGIERRLDAIAPPREAGPDTSEDALAYAQRFPAPRVIVGKPLTVYVTAIMLCVICGIILASPWILYQIWAFVGVGLHSHERRFVYLYGPFSFVLFIGGSAMFYFIMLPVALNALMAPAAGIVVDGMPIFDPSLFLEDYFKFVALLTLVFGVVFQTPLVVMFIAWTEIIPLKTLFKQQRVVIMILLVLSAMFTPPDPVTMIMMAIPMILLYQLGLLLAWFTLRRKRNRRAEEEGEEEDTWGGEDQSTPSAPTGGEGAAAAPPVKEPEGEASEPEYREDDLYDYERDHGEGDQAPEQQAYDDGYPPGEYHYEEEGQDPDAGAPPDAEPPAADEGPPEEEPPEPPAPDYDADIPPEDRMK
ncbi:MAG: twin-arginine translocase subunit TatC [Planctomycetes bacterium]|nr:twin-arginine translocase subunit TatC [Planctomycetota bacterium]